MRRLVEAHAAVGSKTCGSSRSTSHVKENCIWAQAILLEFLSIQFNAASDEPDPNSLHNDVYSCIAMSIMTSLIIMMWDDVIRRKVGSEMKWMHSHKPFLGKMMCL